MGAADGRHLDDLPVEQLDAVVLVQDAQLGQPVVGVHCERTREQANRHLHNIDSTKWPSQFAGGPLRGVTILTTHWDQETRCLKRWARARGYTWQGTAEQTAGVYRTLL